MPLVRNPRWERDELILALDVYFRHRPKLPPSNSHSDVIELSALLNRLPVHPPDVRQEAFRNPNGVYLKLSNFQWIDPDAPGGMSQVSQRDREVWAEFAGNPEALRAAADAIRRNADDADVQLPIDSPESEEAFEGKILMRLHQSRERNRAIVEKKKKQVLAEQGCLRCEVCGFDFAEAYGELGEGFIECHHTQPISSLMPGQATRVSDLALVCANCHRMIHRFGVLRTVEGLRSIASFPLVEPAELQQASLVAKAPDTTALGVHC